VEERRPAWKSGASEPLTKLSDGDGKSDKPRTSREAAASR